MLTRRHANLLVLFAELDAGLGCVQRVRHLLQRIAQAGHNAHAGHDDSSVALPRTVARHETGTPDKHGGSRFEHPFWRTTPICSCVDLGVVWLALRDTDAGEGDTSRPTTLEAASSNATMLASVRQELRGGSTQNSRGLENVRDVGAQGALFSSATGRAGFVVGEKIVCNAHTPPTHETKHSSKGERLRLVATRGTLTTGLLELAALRPDVRLDVRMRHTCRV